MADNPAGFAMNVTPRPDDAAAVPPVSIDTKIAIVVRKYLQVWQKLNPCQRPYRRLRDRRAGPHGHQLRWVPRSCRPHGRLLGDPGGERQECNHGRSFSDQGGRSPYSRSHHRRGRRRAASNPARPRQHGLRVHIEGACRPNHCARRAKAGGLFIRPGVTRRRFECLDADHALEKIHGVWYSPDHRPSFMEDA